VVAKATCAVVGLLGLAAAYAAWAVLNCFCAACNPA